MVRKYNATQNNSLKPKTRRIPQFCEKRTRVRLQICHPRPPCLIDIDGVRYLNLCGAKASSLIPL